MTRESRYVKVDVKKGEETRENLAEKDVINDDLKLEVEDGYLYIPIVDDAEIDASEYEEVGEREFEIRDTLTSPEDILGYAPSFEAVGDIALIEEEDEEEMKDVGEALVEADNNIVTVLNIESKVKGTERTRDLRHVAGEDKTETVHREYGTELVVDLAKVYFSPRLANERQRVVSQVGEGERVFDMFAGVGPFAVPMAKNGAHVVAVDINDDAIRYLRENARRNGVTEKLQVINADVRDVADDIMYSEEVRGADRIIMNLPHSANEFLDSAFSAVGESKEAIIHYYDIRHEDDLFEGAIEEIEEKAEEHGYEIEVLEEVNVRSYAPYDYNICLDIRVTKN